MHNIFGLKTYFFTDCKGKKLVKKIVSGRKTRHTKGEPKPITTQKRHHLKAVSNIKIMADNLNTRKDVDNQEYLAEVMDFVESEKFVKTRLNSTTYRFFCSQVKQQCKKSKGRRYNEEDKIFAMSLLKQSLKEYKLLRKVFALPSKKTMSRVLLRIAVFRLD